MEKKHRTGGALSMNELVHIKYAGTRGTRNTAKYREMPRNLQAEPARDPLRLCIGISTDNTVDNFFDL